MRFLEESLFGVCQKVANVMRIPSANVRMYFIYAAFLTLGASFLVYLVLGFWMNFRRLKRRSRNILWH